MSGIPWWNTDIGGFWGGDTEGDEFRELIENGKCLKNTLDSRQKNRRKLKNTLEIKRKIKHKCFSLDFAAEMWYS